MEVVNAYTISPSDIKQGDVMLFVVKAVVTGEGLYKLYRCEYTASDEIPKGISQDGIPQGFIILHQREVCQALFPSLAQVAEPE